MVCDAISGSRYTNICMFCIMPYYPTLNILALMAQQHNERMLLKISLVMAGVYVCASFSGLFPYNAFVSIIMIFIVRRNQVFRELCRRCHQFASIILQHCKCLFERPSTISFENPCLLV